MKNCVPYFILMFSLSTSPEMAEFAAHHGFDPRLCFGDITLRFRYFSQGLPAGSGVNAGLESP